MFQPVKILTVNSQNLNNLYHYMKALEAMKNLCFSTPLTLFNKFVTSKSPIGVFFFKFVSSKIKNKALSLTQARF